MHKRIIGGVGLTISGVVVLCLLNINFLVRHNKAYLLGRIEQILGRKIAVEQINVTLWPIGARLTHFSMAADLASSAELFRAVALRADLRVLPLLTGRLRLKRIFIESPVISIVRDANGRYNFTRRADHEKGARANPGRGEVASPETQVGPLLLAALVHIAGGTIKYQDLGSGRDLTATQIDLKLSNIDWDEPFEIELQAAVMAAKPNLKFRSRVGPIPETRDYSDMPLDGEIQAEALDLGKINKALPQLRKALPRALRFDGIYTIQDLKFKGPLNNLSLKGAVSGTDASFRFE